MTPIINARLYVEIDMFPFPASKRLELFAFPLFWPWAYPMNELVHGGPGGSMN
jgi:hypothetical protein